MRKFPNCKRERRARACKAVARALALALSIAGCETLPLKNEETRGRSEHTLREEPHRAAVCVARNIDRHAGRLDARIREGRDPVLIEVHVSAGAPVALAQFLVNGTGSTARIWTAAQLAYPRESFVAAMIAGC